jgi:hypothetical protein
MKGNILFSKRHQLQVKFANVYNIKSFLANIRLGSKYFKKANGSEVNLKVVYS